ncbi:MAG: FIST N-terminal domain-containing protein, partial [Desulfobacterales bacterium]
GQRLAEGLIGELNRPPNACWLFCAPQKGIEELLAGIYDVLRMDTIIGCTTDGEISNQGLTTETAVLGGIAADELHFHVVVAEGLGSHGETAGRRLARALPPSIRYVQLFSDGLSGNGCALLRGMAAVLGEDLPISGGTAGDNGKFDQTWQFAGNRVFSDAAVAIGFSGDLKLGTGIRSGWTPIGLAKKVTRASGKILYELNGEPALNVFERFLGKHAKKLPAIGVEYPLGLLGQWGDVGANDYCLLRATMSVNREDGSISFAGEIPEGAMVSLTCGDTTSILDAAEKAAQLALSDLGDSKPGLIFCYSCMARKIVLGRRTHEEIDRIRRVVGPSVPILGFYTYGEYCRMRCSGPSYLHNETVTLSVIGT